MNHRLLAALLACSGAIVLRPAQAETVIVPVIEDAVVHWDKDAPELVEADGYVIRHRDQTIQRTLDLPPAGPVPPRITIRVTATPIESTIDGRLRPNDLWTRLGHVSIVPDGENNPAADEIEALRFVTGYGAKGVFEQDATALGPLLHGRTTVRVHLSTYSERPGWQLSVDILYDADEAGARRPLVATAVFANSHLTAENGRMTATLVVPAGTSTPRIRILSTGHATDGIGANEFVSSTHILRVDGHEVVRWRPWTEAGAGLRKQNPYSGRWTIGGRILYSSDFDRSGWHPGLAVEPTLIPLPELTPGRHEIELEIIGIRPVDADPDSAAHGYWATSAILLADEVWPDPDTEFK